MSTHPIERGDGTSDEIRDEIEYELSASNGVVNLTVRNDGETFSISTDPESAVLLASDIRAAADNATSRDGRNGGQFIFQN